MIAAFSSIDDRLRLPCLRLLFFFLLMFIARGNSLSFSYPSFIQSSFMNFNFTGDANLVSSQSAIALTKNTIGSNTQYSWGRITYMSPLRLWDSGTGEIANFSTSFNASIIDTPNGCTGDGMAFFISPFPSNLSSNSSAVIGGSLGIFQSPFQLNETYNPVVAFEIDTFRNSLWDPSSFHIGINLRSVKSTAYTNMSEDSSYRDNMIAQLNYDGQSKKMTAQLCFADLTPADCYNLSLNFDITQYLPEEVAIGFSGATGSCNEIHSIQSWSFQSSVVRSAAPPPQAPLALPPDAPSATPAKRSSTGASWQVILPIVVVSAAGMMVAVCCLVRRRRKKRQVDQAFRDGERHLDDPELSMEELGPKRFTLRALVEATNNFDESNLIGKGGFGSVYKGRLKETNQEAAIKRLKGNSNQGIKEFRAEIKTISRLQQWGNLVQLLGWCREGDEMLLVYEFVINGSLESHLYPEDDSELLNWPLRFKVAEQLGTVLINLHSTLNMHILHRDIKPSNVLLDDSFNVKLADFGMARLLEHNQFLDTLVAGTRGYMAPEYLFYGIAGVESDIYSYGVVLLEMACGRRPIVGQQKQGGGVTVLVEWVWRLYGTGNIIEAADHRLNGDFDVSQMECMLMVGLWCAHTESEARPTMKMAVDTLLGHSVLPSLPRIMPPPIVGSASASIRGGFQLDSSSGSMALSTTSGIRSSASSSGSMAMSTTSGIRSSASTTMSTTGGTRITSFTPRPPVTSGSSGDVGDQEAADEAYLLAEGHNAHHGS